MTALSSRHHPAAGLIFPEQEKNRSANQAVMAEMVVPLPTTTGKIPTGGMKVGGISPRATSPGTCPT